MKKIFLLLLISFLIFISKVTADTSNKIKRIIEGNKDAKITIITYESLTCSHCGDFHKEIYPNLKKDFIDTGLVKIEFRHFPLDMAALNASKISQCANDGDAEMLHFLFSNQKKWVKGQKIEDVNKHLEELVKKIDTSLNFENCINNKMVEDHILNVAERKLELIAEILETDK